MYEYDKGLSAAISRRRAAAGAGAASWPFPGRHESHEEIADETPIFHALTVGGWRSRQRGTGRAVRAVHRPTVRTPRPATGDVVAAFHDVAAVAAVPVQQRIRARRDDARAADRSAIMHLLGGQGRHRLGAPA